MAHILGLSIGLSAQPALAVTDIYTGTLKTEDSGTDVWLERCDAIRSTYRLLEAAPVPADGAPLATFLRRWGTHRGPIQLTVVGEYHENDGESQLRVTTIDNVKPGKSCHLADMLDALEPTPSPVPRR
ncbi:hypothetical protein EBB59_06875 [Lysobacter pythonis]|uniref:Uncharacterized protein n=2 Tax=Solilutibacter pythonis TaxID=2483112 RepID=A0A3M2HT67_9GAMM|nr:hypothetical protein EBB59_06875 [Lysobacter pythonis]